MDAQSILIKSIDYIVFSLVLVISLAIGIYYSFKQKSTDEYLHGRRELGLFPVTVSLFVSYVSAISMQGLPAEVYLYGLGIMLTCFAMWGVCITSVTFLPIFYDLKCTSVFEYLELRFESPYPKTLASCVATVATTLYSGIILIGPASALESMCGIPTDYNIIIMAVVCTLYTSIGGLRGVIWTDVFQAFVMVAGCVTVLIIGISRLGMTTIWNELEKHGRTDIEFSPNPMVRNSFWICLFGIGFNWFQIFCNQTAMVRYTSLPTLSQAKLCVILAGVGVCGLQFLASSVGAVVFAFYSTTGCGPLASGALDSSNQVVPYFVVNEINYPGIPGLFIAAIVASTLSSASSSQNALVAIVWQDLLSPHLPDMSDLRKTILLKIIVLVFGALGVLIAFMAKYAGETLFNICSTILGAIGTPPFGMFLLGACFTFTSGKAAVIGCLVSCCFSLWITLGKLIHGTTWDKPVLITEGCNVTGLHMVDGINITDMYHHSSWNNNINGTDSIIPEQDNGNVLDSIYSISSYAYPVLSTGITFTVGLLLSAIPAFRHKRPVKPVYLFPFVRKILGYSAASCYKLSKSENTASLPEKQEKYSNYDNEDGEGEHTLMELNKSSSKCTHSNGLENCRTNCLDGERIALNSKQVTISREENQSQVERCELNSSPICLCSNDNGDDAAPTETSATVINHVTNTL